MKLRSENPIKRQIDLQASDYNGKIHYHSRITPSDIVITTPRGSLGFPQFHPLQGVERACVINKLTRYFSQALCWHGWRKIRHPFRLSGGGRQIIMTIST